MRVACSLNLTSQEFHIESNPRPKFAHLRWKRCAALLSVAAIGRATNESRKATATGDTDQVSYTHEALITLRANGFFSATVPAATVLEERSHSAMVSHTFAVRGGNIRLKNRRPRSSAVAFLPRLWRARIFWSIDSRRLYCSCRGFGRNQNRKRRRSRRFRFTDHFMAAGSKAGGS